jgi:hypothetical protein
MLHDEALAAVLAQVPCCERRALARVSKQFYNVLGTPRLECRHYFAIVDRDSLRRYRDYNNAIVQHPESLDVVDELYLAVDAPTSLACDAFMVVLAHRARNVTVVAWPGMTNAYAKMLCRLPYPFRNGLVDCGHLRVIVPKGHSWVLPFYRNPASILITAQDIVVEDQNCGAHMLNVGVSLESIGESVPKYDFCYCVICPHDVSSGGGQGHRFASAAERDAVLDGTKTLREACEVCS